MPESLEPAADSLVSLAGVSPLEGDVSLLLLLLVVVAVVAVEVVCAAAASAVVFVGGVSSGVGLFGTASETLLPPHPLMATPHSNAAHAASAKRALTAAPCACRTWGSR